jgi:hypothetical protein
MRKGSMEEMKKEYMQYTAPDELKDRIAAAVERAENEKKKKRTAGIIRNIGIAVAAAFVFTITVNTNSAVAYALEKIPVIGAITRIVTLRTYTDQGENHEAQVAIPKIQPEEGESLTEGEKQMNQQMEDYMSEIINQYERDISELGGEGYEAVDSVYSTIRDDDELLSVRIDTTFARGGAENLVKIYHLEKASGNILALKDLFQDGSDYVTVLSEAVKEEMRSEMKQDDSKTYFIDQEDMEDEFQSIKEDQTFYISEEGELVLIFDEYEVAPGYMGAVEITVPYSAVESIAAENSYLK